jgi:Fe-S cluster assembly protein SufD
LVDATATYGAFLNNHWAKSMKIEADPFAAINAALHQEGLFLYLPPKCKVSVPIQILHVIDTKNQPMLLMPRFQLFIGAHSQVSLLLSSVAFSGSSYGINQVVDAAVEENAHLHITQVTPQEEGNNWYFEALRAHLKKNARFTCMNMTQGSQTARYDYRVTLAGENAEASLEGIAMLKDNQEAHVHVLMEHIAPHCRSNQLFKSALADHSRFSFEGKILVQELAEKTEAFQRICNLMLSETAHVENKPNLKIFNHDVKASHGATVGSLDTEQMHYLKTRGLSETIAKSLLIAGFLQERINSVPLASLRELISKQIQSYQG